MSAFDNIQLKMFEKAGILANSYSSEKPPSQTKEKFIERKLEESDYQNSSGNGKTAKEGENTLRESIKQHGIQHPVHVTQHGDDKYTLRHGHHRVYVANDIDPEMLVPITEDSTEALGFTGWQDPTLTEDNRWKR